MRMGETETFPRYGARARVWLRFERDLREWLETPEGRFAQWRAGLALEDPRQHEGATD
jgi:hypothetical protein